MSGLYPAETPCCAGAHEIKTNRPTRQSALRFTLQFTTLLHRCASPAAIGCPSQLGPESCYECNPTDRAAAVATGQQRPSWTSPPRNSAAPRRVDCGGVDLRHAPSSASNALCFIAARRQRLGQHTRRDLPRDTPHLSFHQPHALSWPP
jgi:hypothetical protein